MLFWKQTKLHWHFSKFSLHSGMFLSWEHDIKLFYLSKFWMIHNWLQLNALLADSERDRLVKKLSHANQQNRLLKRQVQRHGCVFFQVTSLLTKDFTFHFADAHSLSFIICFGHVLCLLYLLLYWFYMVQINLETRIKILQINLFCLSVSNLYSNLEYWSHKMCIYEFLVNFM